MDKNQFSPDGIRILVIGDVMLDRYVYGNVTRVSPEDPACLVLDHVPPIERRVGGAANVALNLAAMGADVDLVGLAGNGKYREQFKATLDYQLSLVGRKRDAVSVELVESDRPFTIKTRYCFKDRQLLRVDHECRHPQTEEECDRLMEIVDSLMYSPKFPAPHLTILSDYAKGTLDGPFLQRLIHGSDRLLRNNEFVVDPKRTDFDIYGHPLAICPNEHEFTGYVHESQAHHLVVTRGMNGCDIYSYPDRRKVEIPAPAVVEICDPTGAGDSFVSALTLSLAMKLPIEQAGWIANLAGGLAVQHQGTTGVSRKALEAAIDTFAGQLP